jgi:hypothetical protein
MVRCFKGCVNLVITVWYHFWRAPSHSSLQYLVTPAVNISATFNIIIYKRSAPASWGPNSVSSGPGPAEGVVGCVWLCMLYV